MAKKVYDIIDGAHRITIAHKLGYPKVLDALIYYTKAGEIHTRVERLPVSALVTNSEINPRELKSAHLRYLEQRWNPSVLGVVHVRETQDSVPDRVGAGLFRGLNKHLNVTFFDDFTAAVTERDPDAVAIVGILGEFGLKLDKAGGDGLIRSPKTLWRIYGGGKAEKHADLLRQTLGVVTKAYGVEDDALDHQILDGVSRVLRRYGDAIDKKNLIRKLSKTPGGPTRIIGKARGLKDIIGATMANAVAETIVEIYNKGLRKNKLPGWRS